MDHYCFNHRVDLNGVVGKLCGSYPLCLLRNLYLDHTEETHPSEKYGHLIQALVTTYHLADTLLDSTDRMRAQ